MSQFASKDAGVEKWDKYFAEGDAFIIKTGDKMRELLRSTKHLDGYTLGLLKELGGAEDSLKREYDGRFLFELLQNGDDAMTDKMAQLNAADRERELNRVSIILTNHSLIVANDGLPFGQNNIAALCRLFTSTKSASKQIGHKGIGFKSVLEISDKPEVYSAQYAFGFDRQRFTEEIIEITGDQDVDFESQQILRVPYVRRLAFLPYEDRQIVEQLLDHEYATIIRLPLKPFTNIASIAQQIRDEATPVLLLFLESTRHLLVRLPEGESIAFWLDLDKKEDEYGKHCYYMVKLSSETNGEQKLHSRWLLIAPEVIQIANRELVTELGKAWQDVQAVKCSAAFRLTLDGEGLDLNHPEQTFNVYFPTEEKSGLRFLLNADFYIQAARKDIRLNEFNQWLAAALAQHVAIAGVDAIKSQFPNDPAIVELLVSLREQGRDFSNYFISQYLLALRGSRFVPNNQGQYHIPAQIRFTPMGADSYQFRKLFAPGQISSDAAWHYAHPVVEEREKQRKDKFLLREELGTTEITLRELANAVRNGPPDTGTSEHEILSFLAKWHQKLPYHMQTEFERVLRACAIIPTQYGWQAPSTKNIFQANLSNEDEIDVPPGFDLSLVPLRAYGDDRAYDGPIASFLKAMDVSSYQAAIILARSIFPIMTNRERFKELLAENDASVYAGYRLLLAYHDRKGGGTQFDKLRAMVLVPCYRLHEPEKPLWQPAGMVYFSTYWSGRDDLEKLYGSFEDGYFMGPIPELLNSQDEVAKESWFEFFHWLGVNLAPRLIEQTDTRLINKSVYHHAFSSRPHWSDYLNSLGDQLDCPTDHHKHDPNRIFTENFSLHHFEELAANADVTGQLFSFFRLLGHNWHLYEPHITIRASCRYKTCYRISEEMPSYFYYCLQNLPWLPAEQMGTLETKPSLATDIWNLGLDVSPVVRKMLPSLPEEFLQDRYFLFRADLLRRENDIDDYITLLLHLPQICPVEREGIESAAPALRNSVRTVFNWTCQAIQNNLVHLGQEQRPPLPANLKLLAYRDGIPAYIPADDPLLVYGDDNYIARAWESDLWFLRVDTGWNRLRSWLQIPSISSQIEVEPYDLVLRPSETTVLYQKYQAVLPAFLAVVHQQQYSNYRNILGRMKRLNIRVVDKLLLSQTYRPQPNISKETREEIFLFRSIKSTGPGEGEHLQEPTLYVDSEAFDNPYIFGRPIATYIEIAGLRDTFVLLFSQPDPEARLRYLEARKIKPGILQEIAEDLDSDISLVELDLLQDAWRNRSQAIVLDTPHEIVIVPRLPSAPETSLESSAEPDADGQDQAVEVKIPAMPPLATDFEISMVDYKSDGTVPETGAIPLETGRKSITVGGSGGGGRVSEKITEAYGYRGEKYAFCAEKQRLRRLGFSDDVMAEKVRWLSQENKYARCDIISVDGTPENYVDIFIEVKATTGSDPTVFWTKAEYDLAQEAGDRYWFYWVGQVKSERPTLTRYQNPVRLLRENRARIDFSKLIITLPDKQEEED